MSKTFKNIPLTFEEILARLKSEPYIETYSPKKRRLVEVVIGNIFIDEFEEKHEPSDAYEAIEQPHPDEHDCRMNAVYTDDGPQGPGRYCTECGSMVYFTQRLNS